MKENTAETATSETPEVITIEAKARQEWLTEQTRVLIEYRKLRGVSAAHIVTMALQIGEDVGGKAAFKAGWDAGVKALHDALTKSEVKPADFETAIYGEAHDAA